MKRTSTFLFGIFLLVMLSVGMIGAGERLPPEGPLAQFYDQIHALFVETGLLAAESNDQQEQIDQLKRAVCGLSTVAGGPTHPEFCEVVVTTCECFQTADCACDPGPDFELESCESASFPHPSLGKIPPPKCGTVAGCQGTFTRTAAGDVGDIEVNPHCGGEVCPGCGTNNPPPGDF
ncbi:MAG: hypothetical protein JRE38_13280 [Deltaproteobacteria bacterium]|nr:hypothetical protein [Deltaproteobacteria bacterium]